MRKFLTFKVGINIGMATLAIVTLLKYKEPVAHAWRVMRNEIAPTNKAAPKLVAPGIRLMIKEANWGESVRSVVVLANTGCRPCQQSRSFYSDLAIRIERLSGLRLVVLTPQSHDEMSTWLADAGITSALIIHVDDPSSMGFLVFPTLLIVDSHGVVTDTLLGELDSQWQLAVIRRLDSATVAQILDNTRYVPEVSSLDELPSQPGRQRQIVDIRERREFGQSVQTGVKNIPADELPARARAELQTAEPLALVCPAEGIMKCRVLGRMLRDHGFRQVALVIPAGSKG